MLINPFSSREKVQSTGFDCTVNRVTEQLCFAAYLYLLIHYNTQTFIIDHQQEDFVILLLVVYI